MALHRWAFVAVVVAAVLAEDAPKTMAILVPEPAIPAIATPAPKGNRSNNATFAGSPFWSKNKTGLSPFRLPNITMPKLRPNITMPKPRLAPMPRAVERKTLEESMMPPVPPKAASGPGVGRPPLRPVAHVAAEVSIPRQAAPGPPKGFPKLPDCKTFDACVSDGTNVDKCCSMELGSNERACGLCAKAACSLRADFCAGYSRSNWYCTLCFQIADRELLIKPAPPGGGPGAQLDTSQLGAQFGAKLPPLTLPTFGQKGKPGRGAKPGAKAWPKPKVQPPRNAHSGMSSFKHEM
mmetsp:Transcript_72427/g.234097  ORF Transcript_72427/g.234097 Transcript_72427/m.234097 type:complete len:294 (-) Transcript_72427:180-1061(-)